MSFAKHLKIAAAAVICAILVTETTWIYAQSRRASSGLSAEDQLEIYQLYNYYSYGVDVGPDDASWLYTSDGAFETRPGRRTEGQQQLKVMYANILKAAQEGDRKGLRHLLTDIVVTATPGGGAKGMAYMFEVDGRDPTKPATIGLFGRYSDTFVKTRDGWRFKERLFTYDLRVGAGAAASTPPR